METAQNFPDKLLSNVAVKLGGKEYQLRRFTFRQEIMLKKIAGGDLQKWQENFSKLDAETMVNTLHLFMDKTTDFPTPESLLDVLDCTLEQKMAIMNAITCCITAAMPDVQESLKKKTEEAVSQFRAMLTSQLTGPGSSTNSSIVTDGEQPTL